MTTTYKITRADLTASPASEAGADASQNRERDRLTKALADIWPRAIKAERERDQAREQVKTLTEQLADALDSLKVIRAEMDALKRNEPNPDKRLRRLGACFDWNLVVYDPIARIESEEAK